MPDEQSTRADAFEKERAAFEENYRRVLDLTMTEDAWGRPKYIHSHVDALFSGWMARASLVEVPLPGVVTLSADEAGRVRTALEMCAHMEPDNCAICGWHNERGHAETCELGLALRILTRAQKEG